MTPTQPTATTTEVSEAMVERAYDAFTRSFGSKPIGTNNTRNDLRAALEAALSSPPGDGVPGMVLVPVDPTPEMYGAGGVQQFKCDLAQTPVRETVGLVYRAMVEAERGTE